MVLCAVAESTDHAEFAFLHFLKPCKHETNQSALTHGEEYYPIVFDPKLKIRNGGRAARQWSAKL
jgi:hypothetical protein